MNLHRQGIEYRVASAIAAGLRREGIVNRPMMRTHSQGRRGLRCCLHFREVVYVRPFHIVSALSTALEESVNNPVRRPLCENTYAAKVQTILDVAVAQRVR